VTETLRIVVATGDSPGHVFPEIALTRELRARGHEVLVETTERWRDLFEEAGARALVVAGIAEVLARPTFDHRLVEAARGVLEHLRDFDPDIVVADVGAAAPPLAAELADIPTATLLPSVYPVESPGLPFYGLGLMPARTLAGRLAWRAAAPLTRLRTTTRWLQKVPSLVNQVRDQLGLAPLDGSPDRTTSYGMLSETLVLVHTFPQLEYPRRWPPHMYVTGPMLFERPTSDIDLPEGDGPLVLVAASTAQDPGRDLLHTALDALAAEGVRVLAAIGRIGARWPGPVADNVRVVDWVSLPDVMPRAALLVCSGGPGLVAHALAEGLAILVSPNYGDQPELGARVSWAGAGLMVPNRLSRPGSMRWAARRMLADPRFKARAEELAAWSREHDGAARGAALVERYAPR
jgi:UDP:flavonoid glycosyltransferase YjiC (YdhE family)